MTSVGVCAIALNEEQFAARWAKSAADADYILVADTGSTDKTCSILEGLNVDICDISVRPWRFDDARNTALALLPSDLDAVISLDMDEVLVPGWRAKFEAGWKENCTRLRYRYVWSWFAPGIPDVSYYGDKISGRHTHRWKHPVHEILKPTVAEVSCFIEDILIEHHPDSSKPRSQYLPLLELAIKEDPEDDRCSHYLGREYYWHGQLKEAIKELNRHLSLPRAQWLAERAASMRYLGKCYELMRNSVEADYWYTNATLEDPASHEALIDAARFALGQKRFYAVLDYCEKTLALPSTGGSYLNERYALSEGPYDLAAVAHYRLGNKPKAIQWATKAISLNPHDPRLVKNLQMMKNGE